MSIALAREANNVLHEGIQVHPDRFAGFAALPTPNPEAAADELERTVTEFGFKGALISGLSNGMLLVAAPRNSPQHLEYDGGRPTK